MLITKQLKELNEDEEEIIVDYLEDLGIEIDLDMDEKTMCKLLLDKVMEEEIGKKVPMTAFANMILQKEEQKIQEKESMKRKRALERKRKNIQKSLQSQYKEFPGCVDTTDLIPKISFTFIIDPDLGVQKTGEGDMTYTSSVGLNSDLYREIFLNISNPVIELTTLKGEKAYARLTEPLDIPKDEIYINPLVARLLNIEKINVKGFIRLCNKMPYIDHVNFTYYGNQEELANNLQYLIKKLPFVINAFSSLSLGMELVVMKNGKSLIVRVDELKDDQGKPIFAGLIPTGDVNIPFDIIPDV